MPERASCGSGGGQLDAGAPVTGTVTASGGKLSRLLFAVVGDTVLCKSGDVEAQLVAY